MRLRSPAKVNLFLEVLKKRDDGYHEIETLITPISLFDRIRIEASPDIRVRCSHPDIPNGSGNLVHRALVALRDHCDLEQGITVTIDKRIPPGSGLGGGSSNAAACLLGVNRLLGLNLDRSTLLDVGASIGSDVNAFLTPGASICRGRGEITEKAALPDPLHLLLLIPDIQCETPKVYEKAAKFLNSDPMRVSLSELKERENWSDKNLFNRLQQPAFEVYPELETFFREVRRISEGTPLLSGSGSTVFFVSPDSEQIQQEHDRFSSRSLTTPFKIFTVQTLPDEWHPFEPLS